MAEFEDSLLSEIETYLATSPVPVHTRTLAERIGCSQPIITSVLREHPEMFEEVRHCIGLHIMVFWRLTVPGAEPPPNFQTELLIF